MERLKLFLGMVLCLLIYFAIIAIPILLFGTDSIVPFLLWIIAAFIVGSCDFSRDPRDPH